MPFCTKIEQKEGGSLSELLNGLNQQQRKIVETVDGKVLVLAGAGTGKTRTLTYRIAYILEQELAKPHNILAVTFTNKAAQEMKDRVRELVGINKASKWWIGTFHSICVRILVRHGKEIGIPSHFTIADEKDQKSLIKKILKDYTSLSDVEPEYVLKVISEAKNNIEYPSDLELKRDIKHDIPKVYKEYQERLARMNALDFDDLIMSTVNLLSTKKEIREIYQNQFKYVMVDESQDLNKAQYVLAKTLSEGHNNLSLIGDQDQGIYSWRGANIGIINAFAELPETKVMRLEQNYRCTQNIVDASNAVVKNNEERLDKSLVTDNPDGHKLVTFTADTQYQEAGFVSGIVDYCCHNIATNDYSDFTVLYRTNMQSRAIEDELSKRHIPYQIIGGMSFYERAEIKDMLAYMKLIFNPHDALSLQRIINVPKRGIGAKSSERIINLIEKENVSAVDVLDRVDGKVKRISSKSIDALKKLQNNIKFFQGQISEMEPDEFIKSLALSVGYLDMLDDSEEKDRVLNVYELANMARVAKDQEETTLEQFVKNLCLISDQDTVENDNSVKLMTAHTAKGLEFPIVFIIGMEENIFPHYLSVISNSQEKLEEERRLFYVSMTRAKERLYLTNAEKRSLFGKEKKNAPSRFLKEIPDNLIKSI